MVNETNVIFGGVNNLKNSVGGKASLIGLNVLIGYMLYPVPRIFSYLLGFFIFKMIVLVLVGMVMFGVNNNKDFIEIVGMVTAVLLFFEAIRQLDYYV